MPTNKEPPSGAKHSTLAAALAAAVSEAHAVEKAARNEHHRYSYASSEAIIGEAQRVLGACGLSFSAIRYRCLTDALTLDVTVGARDAKKVVRATFAELETTYLLEHESGESRRYRSSTPIIPEAGRPPDRALATAKTYDLGYILRSLLLLPRVEEGTEVDRRNDLDWTPAERPKAKPKPRQAPKEEEIGRTREEKDAENERTRAWREYLQLRREAGYDPVRPENPPRKLAEIQAAIDDLEIEIKAQAEVEETK